MATPGLWTFPKDIEGNAEPYGHYIKFSAYTAATFATQIYSSKTNTDNFIIYIPGGGQNNLLFSQTHEYDEVKLTRLGAGILSSILGIGGSDTATGVAQAVGGLFRKSINPKVEVLFRSTELRSFDFSFMFTPETKEESDLLYGNAPGTGLLNRFRWNAAPQISGAATAGLLFSSPSEWTIEFYYNNGAGWVINPNLPKISKCVCTRIDVDMNPDSEFSTFQNGAPVSSRLTVRFAEMEIIDKTRIEAGY